MQSINLGLIELCELSLNVTFTHTHTDTHTHTHRHDTVNHKLIIFLIAECREQIDRIFD